MRRLFWMAVGAAGGIWAYKRGEDALAQARARGVVGNVVAVSTVAGRLTATTARLVLAASDRGADLADRLAASDRAADRLAASGRGADRLAASDRAADRLAASDRADRLAAPSLARAERPGRRTRRDRAVH